MLWKAALLGVVAFGSIKVRAKEHKLEGEPMEIFEISYENPAWNTNNTQRDFGQVYFRRLENSYFYSLILDETTSGHFRGQIKIPWRKVEGERPEIFVLTEPNKREDSRSLPLGAQQKPYVFFLNENHRATIEIFNEKSQASLKFEKMRDEFNRRKNLNFTVNPNAEGLKPPQSPTVTKADPLAAQFSDSDQEEAQYTAAKDRFRSNHIKRKKDWQRLELKNQERKSNLAFTLENQAVQLYQAKKYRESMSLAQKAYKNAPINENNLYLNGTLHYRLGEFDKALMAIEASQPTEDKSIERTYLLGLTQFSRGKKAAAEKYFLAAKQESTAPIQYMSAYYLGLLYTQNRKWDPALKEFDFVLTHSNNPSIDKQADQYIEFILKHKQEEEFHSKRLALGANLGLIYDSNILLAANSLRDQGVILSEGLRVLTQGSLGYRFFIDEDHSFSTQINVLKLQSYRTNFSASKNLEKADPLLFNLMLPYARNTRSFGLASRWTLTPGFESIFMTFDNPEGKLENILNSPLVSVTDSIILNELSLLNLTSDFRYDISKLKSAVGANDPTAFRARLGATMLNSFGAGRKFTWGPEAFYTWNFAEGKNNLFRRLDLGLGLYFPWRWDTHWNMKLSYFNIDYYENLISAQSSRKDNNYSLSLGFNKPLSPQWSWTLNTSHMINNSNLSSLIYDKTTILSSLSYIY